MYSNVHYIEGYKERFDELECRGAQTYAKGPKILGGGSVVRSKVISEELVIRVRT